MEGEDASLSPVHNEESQSRIKKNPGFNSFLTLSKLEPKSSDPKVLFICNSFIFFNPCWNTVILSYPFEMGKVSRVRRARKSLGNDP